MSLSEEAKKAQREYLKEWRSNNKERVSRYNKKYRELYPEKVKAAKERYWEKKAKGM